jgi:signal transduction histidine kinase/CheY-like chemotaxis protein/HPt (histidine-containing phosphotransfer) domain-containing protein
VIRRWSLAVAALLPAGGAWVALAVVLTWIAVGLHLHDERTHALAAARSNGANLARAFAESLLRGVREIDLTLLFIRALRERGGASADLAPWIDQVERLHVLNLRIGITDRSGLVRLDALRPLRDPIDLSDRAYFRFLASHPDDVLVVSPPVIGRLLQHWTVPFARRLRDRQGGFDGILVLSIPAESLLRFAAPVELGRQGTVTVLGLDGVLRARMAGGQMQEVAGTGSVNPAAGRAAREEDGVFAWTDPADRVARLESFRRVPGLDLVVSVGLAQDAVLAGYQRDLRRLTAAAAVVTLLLLSLAISGARERRRRTAAQTALGRTLASISQGIVMVAPQGDVMVMNGRTRELLGLPPQFGPGCQVGDIVRWQIAQGESGPGGSPPAYLTETTPASKHVRPDGTVLEARCHRLDDGCLVRTFSDVTDWERTQQALQIAREAAEAANCARTQFLAMMSHEIRTPLNGILGVAELLGDTGLAPEQEGYARTIRDCGRHLLHVLNDVLDFSMIDSGALDLDCAPFAPRSVLDTVRAMVAGHAEERGVRLLVEASPAVPARVLGDAGRLRQVLLNLLGNAVKFTPAGEVALRLDAQPVAAGWRLEGEVRDTGIGIEPEMLGCLFNEFTQADGSVTRRFGGTGLGLAICRRLLEAMGGSITAESQPGVGSTFRFSLIAGTAPEEVAPPPVAAPAKLRVLVAEDNRVNRLVATRLLEREGYVVQAVQDGAAALTAARGGGFDLVLMDVMMPAMDGLEATRAIRALPGPAGQVKVIGLTAGTSRDDEAACRGAGMDGFAPKPITPERLSREIARICAEPAAPPGPPEAGTAPAAIDPSALAALDAALGEGTAAEIAATFLADAPARLDRMRALAASGAADLLAREAHALAGSAGTLGLRALAAAARSLETGVAISVAELPARLAPLEALADEAVAWLTPLAVRHAA